MNAVRHRLARLVPGTAQERGALWWSFAYFFVLLAGYYVLRPLRDEMAIAGGVRNLPWMFTATFATLLAAQPLYGALVARLPRARFIPVVYHFFAANLALFWLLLSLDLGTVMVARVFFVWVSVFNLFAVAVFWSFMADIFNGEQGKRLFGFIGAGGTAGALLGPVITFVLSVPLGPVNLLIAAVIFLELAVFCVYRLERAAAHLNRGEAPKAEKRIGGGAFAALPELARSPYLLGVACWVSLLSFGGTILYFEQANIVASTVHGAGAQTRIFAGIDLAVSLLTLATQFFATGKLIQRFGTGAAAAASAGGLCRGLRDLGRGAGPGGGGGDPGRATLDELRHLQPGAADLLYRRRARGEIQGQEPDRRGGVPRLGRAIWLGVRQPPVPGAEARRDRAVRAAGGLGLGGAVHGARPDPGTPRRRRGIRHGIGRLRRAT